MSANLSGVIDRLRSGTCWFTASNAEPLHHDHHKTGASPPNRTASSCSSGRRADHLRQRGMRLAPRERIELPPRDLETLVLPLHQRGITLWWASLESNQECLPQGTGVTARWCTRHSTKTPIDCWSGWLGSNQRPPRPKRGALPTAPHPDW